jgi:hypothetical protein
LQGWYRDAITRAYALAKKGTPPWEAPMSVETIRESKSQMEEMPGLELVSEPTAALVDRIIEVPDEVFLIVDIGAGTTDIAIMARFDRLDRILAQDTVPSGGRLLTRVFDELVQKYTGTSTHLDDFHRLLRDEKLSLGGETITAKELLDHGEAADWLESVNAKVKAVRAQAMDRRVITRQKFSEAVSRNIYISGGIGRSPVVRRRLLPLRNEVPRPIPLPLSCNDWARVVGSGADDLFLQLAPVVGALSMNARYMGGLPPPINPPKRMYGADNYDLRRGER